MMEELLSGSSLISRFDTFLLDCDGVLWSGDHIIKGVPETIQKLRALGKKIYFVTNNSTKTRQQHAEKIRRLGIEGTTEGEVLSTAYATAQYLKGKDFSVYAIGEEGLVAEIKEAGLKCTGLEDNGKQYNMDAMAEVKVPRDIGAVVVGLDRGFNMHKLAYAMLCLKQNKDCLFIATNRDPTFPMHGGVVLPGAGSVVSSVVTAAGREPDVVIGKPEPLFLDVICNSNADIDLTKTCMVGDRLDTDIAFGKSRSLATLLVLTGVTSREYVFSKSNTIHPDYILPSITDLFS
eukprot:TRINITY_DN184_c1_g1_i1.p1 TRINITY_DN184_c1_g1~~TRINITY_DN184_c1_g1_i1.p1  ORF type:complete len:291 (-),score=43.29 TRINITY_DN184_c1_g1_i1:33-905(-)